MKHESVNDRSDKIAAEMPEFFKALKLVAHTPSSAVPRPKRSKPKKHKPS